MPSDQQGKFVEVLVAYVRSPLFDQRSAPVKKRSATRRSFLRAVGAGATALPFYRLLENSVAGAGRRAAAAALLRHLPPARHRRRVLRVAERPVLGLGSDTETNFNLTYTTNGAQCVLQPFDDAATYGKSFKSKILADRGRST